MIPVLLPEAETETMLAEARPQTVALAIAVDLDRGGGRLRRRSLVQIALLPALCAAGLTLLADAHPAWAWILAVPLLLLLGNALLDLLSGRDFRRSARAASTHLGGDLDALLEAGRGMPETPLPGTDDLLLRFDDQGGIRAVALAGSRHARLRLLETLVEDGLPAPWAAWARHVRPAALLRHQDHLLVLTEDGVPAAFRPGPKDRPA